MNSINNKEKLGADIRRQVIERYLQKITNEHPQMYYAATAEIAHAIHEQLKNRINSLDLEEQLQVKNLSVRDIEVILSFKD